ncbi:hypothetical protein NIES37_03550 [Tolypothrix tenuis PCC 7101]|uniref:Uncharacterized protein n=1 Tax=Tolypothrix tenuis PCC 7101 TaxID=231146 RepID=A0A1Z4MSJ3_9CYAN|nr:hypothetical protein [Aulosira sp. FACHB-113]BAY96422.1 hypothetical protein NIES37_03550 [Tolypothrix tenuis PCC 7101]BAZ73070.1 hypothetical protein NIES50_16280 [Aulosira laxa NIES-50]
MQGSIIGSFRKYYREIRGVIDLFESAGIFILSPKKSQVINPDEEFILLESDDLNYSPVEIQLIAFHRILRSSFVYTFCPNGYIGRTTAYEIGRVVERKIKLFFSEAPKDLPIFLPQNSIWSPKDFSKYFLTNGKLPETLEAGSKALSEKLHNDLFLGKYQD